MRRITVLAIVTVLSTIACAEGPTAPAERPATPRENFVNGPEDLRNVSRFATNNADFVIRDGERQLALAVGKEAFHGTDLCEFLPTDIMTVQEVGAGDSGTTHTLARAEGLHLSLFRVVTPPCETELLGKGTGTARFVSHRADAHGRPDPFTADARGVVESVVDDQTWRVHGVVTAVRGETLVGEIRLRPAAGN
ncbi:MAG TPA: hypothetical protein VMM83_05385 [Longimicrobiales bacterium]|nr:hypothetical protein [Longimicrobiales bacterium]